MSHEHKQQHWLYQLASSIVPELVFSSTCFALLVLCNMLMSETRPSFSQNSHVLLFLPMKSCCNACCGRLSFSLKGLKLSPSTVIVTTSVH